MREKVRRRRRRGGEEEEKKEKIEIKEKEWEDRNRKIRKGVIRSKG